MDIDLDGDLDSADINSLSDVTSFKLSFETRFPRLRFLTHPNIEFLLEGDSEWLIMS